MPGKCTSNPESALSVTVHRMTANFILVGTFSLHEHDVYVCERDVSMVIATFLIG